MNIALICFTKNGASTCRRMIRALNEQGHQCRGWKKGTFTDEGDRELEPVSSSLRDWTEGAFNNNDALIFIGASGIAVRAIAPFVTSKTADPACIVSDERGNYVIPLLSGHIGGANELARQLADALEAVPVITTATDVNGLFAVDEWAQRNGLFISSMAVAKQVAAHLLQGKTIALSSMCPIKGTLPQGVVLKEELREPAETEIRISICREQADHKRKTDPVHHGAQAEGKPLKKQQEPSVLQLIPRCVVLGIGCRRDTPKEAIQALVSETLKNCGLSEKSLLCVASIDLKAQEPGLLEFCREWGLPFQVFSAGELQQVQGEFTASSFVRGITGVDNVCERAAVLASGGGRLAVKKQAQDGVTLAAAVKDMSYSFDTYYGTASQANLSENSKK